MNALLTIKEKTISFSYNATKFQQVQQKDHKSRIKNQKLSRLI